MLRPALLAPTLAALVALIAACGARTGLRVPDASEPGDDARADAPMPDAPRLDAPPPDAPAPDAPVSARCGDGVVNDPLEQCDLGAQNALVPAFALRQPPAVPETPVTPVLRRTDSVSFYRYQSASAHTGFEALETGNLFLYVNPATDELALFFLAGRDLDSAGPPAQPSSMMSADFRGVPAGARVVLSDDPTTPPEFGPGAAAGEFVGNWSFNANTDGGVLTAIAWDRDWTITVATTFTAGVTSWRYIDGPSGSTRDLARTVPAELIHRTVPSRCRPDCRVPRCGDGFVDAGERCDDGNTRSGDGCASDCQRHE